MEEKKNKKAVSINMSTAPKREEKKQKLSYDELNDACAQLYQQNQHLTMQLQQANMVNMFKRLDYLFKVIEFSDVIKDAEFINACIAEVREAMTVDTGEKEVSGEN